MDLNCTLVNPALICLYYKQLYYVNFTEEFTETEEEPNRLAALTFFFVARTLNVIYPPFAKTLYTHTDFML